MSKPTRAAEAARTDSLTFEDALKRLETIVDAMESDELPLEALIARYEEGMKLSGICQLKIADAELKIHQLEKTAGGLLTLKPVAAIESDDDGN